MASFISSKRTQFSIHIANKSEFQVNWIEWKSKKTLILDMDATHIFSFKFTVFI